MDSGVHCISGDSRARQMAELCPTSPIISQQGLGARRDRMYRVGRPNDPQSTVSILRSLDDVHCPAIAALIFPFFILMRPDRLDLWIVDRLGRLVGQHPIFDLGIQSAIGHNVLGGYWFAAAVFVLWMERDRLAVPQARQRMWVVLAGSLLAVALALLCGLFLRWAPPNRIPSLAHFFPYYILPNPNQNCFPSVSVALYASVASGVYSLHRPAGLALWFLVFGAVGLPRMYVGGHYASDVLVGAVLGLFAYFVARRRIEPWLSPCMASLSRRTQRARWIAIAGEAVMFVWILQLAVEFREAVWVTHIMEFLAGRGGIH